MRSSIKAVSLPRKKRSYSVEAPVRHALAIWLSFRSYVAMTPFGEAARKVMLRTCLASFRVREALADIVDMAIEKLGRQGYELPGFRCPDVESDNIAICRE